MWVKQRRKKQSESSNGKERSDEEYTICREIAITENRTREKEIQERMNDNHGHGHIYLSGSYLCASNSQAQPTNETKKQIVKNRDT